MGQYCFAHLRLSASSVVVCNAAGVRSGRPAAGRVDGRRALFLCKYGLLPNYFGHLLMVLQNIFPISMATLQSRTMNDT